MSNALHTSLGAGGVIGRELMRELAAFTDRIRLVRRRPQPPSAVGIEACAADLRNPGQVADAVRGSAVAYLVAGLPYRTAEWQAEWPLIMGNVIAACRQHSVRLVFFDNVYDSTKFQRRFFTATSYQEGVEKTVRCMLR